MKTLYKIAYAQVMGVQYDRRNYNMKTSVFVNEVIDFKQAPYFLGEGRNVIRLDLDSEPFIEKLKEKALGQTWFKHDFSYIQDAKDFIALHPKQQVLFLKNLKFQTVLDSVATRTVTEVFKPVTSNPQLESWWAVHGFQEDIHSDSYAELIKSLPLNSTDVFDEIMVTPEILSRAKLIIDRFDDTIMWNSKLTLQTDDYNREDHMRSILFSLYALNILEAGLFQTSFICTFAYAENGVMESSGKSMGRIKKDENNHMAITIHLINAYRKDPEWAYLVNEIQDEVRQMYISTYVADNIWIDYLYEDGASLLGLNAKVLKEYSAYNMHRATHAIGITGVADEVKMNPCSWADKYTKTANLQVALNEADGTNYLLGRLNKNMDRAKWNTLKI